MDILKGNNKHRVDGAKLSNNNFHVDERPRDVNGDALPFEVGMVSKCIAFYRKKALPIKRIWLSEMWFNQLDYWARRCMTEEQADSNIKQYTFDGVMIDRMERSHIIRNSKISKEMDWEFYPMNK